MGIWNRLGNVLKSYVNDGADRVFNDHKPRHSVDDDFNAAYEELEDYLKGDKTEHTRESGRTFSKKETPSGRRAVPSELKRDFVELGLNSRASEDECKEAYKKLLKIHHPDRHGGNPELMKKATEKTARINASYDRLVTWFKAGA